jgi:hypothetical protein
LSTNSKISSLIEELFDESPSEEYFDESPYEE